MCCSVLQCVAVVVTIFLATDSADVVTALQVCVEVCCNVLQCVAACRSVLQHVAMCCNDMCCNVLQCVAVYCDYIPCDGFS